MKEYEVWLGQVCMNGMEDGPTGPIFIGKYEAESFVDACKMAEKEGKIKIRSLDPLVDDFAIGIYDNQDNAHDLEKFIRRDR